MANMTTTKKTTIIKYPQPGGGNLVFSYTFTSTDPVTDDVNVYVNSQKLNPNSQEPIASAGGLFVIYIDAPYEVDTVVVNMGQNDTLTYVAKKIDFFEKFDRIGNMVDDDTSFMLLRVNPKLTGNVKVVIDSNMNMYMDTFKVSKGLSQKKYRKIPVNYTEYYGRALMAAFKDMPIDDFYKIDDFCYDLFSSANTLDDQYYDIYNCGVRTNRDKMYNENFSILAPLCVRKKMPDFFIVFKAKDGLVDTLMLNQRTGNFFQPNPTHLLDNEYCEIVKCFDMREGTKLGTYIRNIYENHKDFIGYAYDGENTDMMNTFNGISVERGVVTTMYESGHETDLVTNQVALNQYFTEGFQRNHIVSKDIINLEFMFDDPSEDLFSINQYYGLYIRLNGEQETFSCIDSSNGTNIFDTEISGIDFDPSNRSNTSILYGLSTPNGFERLTENVFQSENVSKYKLRPFKNISAPKFTDIKQYAGTHCFVSVQLNDVMDPGEHYRIIDNEEKQIYDVIISNAYDETDFSDFSYDSSTYYGEQYHITRISVLNNRYRKTVKDIEKESIMGRQCNLVAAAFNSFNSNGKFTAYSNNKDVFSIVAKKQDSTNSNNIIFEKVLSICGYNETNLELIRNEDIHHPNYYNDESSYIFGIKSLNRNIISTNMPGLGIYYPYGFECLGDRLFYAAYFEDIQTTMFERTPALIDEDITNLITMYKTVIFPLQYPLADSYERVLQITDVRSIQTNGIFESTNHDSFYMILGFGDEKNYYTVFNHEPKVQGGKIHFYQNYPLNAGVCSIFQIKDFYHTVLDRVNHHMLENGTGYTPNGCIYQTGGEYQLSPYYRNCYFTEENFTNYVDSLNTYLPNNDYRYQLTSDASLGEYIENLINNDHTNMDISVIVPNCCKWMFVGTGGCGERMRLMYNLMMGSQDSSVDPWRPTLLEDQTSYNITDDSSTFVGLLSGNPSDARPKTIRNYNSYEDYVKFYDSIHNGKSTIGDLLHNDRSIHRNYPMFSKLCKYGSDSVEFLCCGTKVRMKTSDKSRLDLTKYSGYSIILVAMNGNNPKHNTTYELFIDETSEQMALFTFNGIDSSSLSSQGVSIPYFEAKHVESIDKGVMSTVPTIECRFLDDGYLSETMWDGTSLIYDGSVALVSIPHKIGSVQDDPYVMVVGRLSRFETDLDGKTYMILDNITILKNGTPLNDIIDATNALNTVDMYVVTDTAPPPYDVSRASLSLEKMKSLDHSCNIFIKQESGYKEYEESDNILQIKFPPPLYTTRVKDSSVYSTSGYTHPFNIVPVMQDVLNFTCMDSQIENISRSFNKGMNATNIKFVAKEGLAPIRQTWMRKFMKLDGTTLIINSSQNDQSHWGERSQRENPTNTIGLTILKEMDPLVPYWYINMCRIFDNLDTYTAHLGAYSGYEKNTFLGSRGITLKSRDASTGELKTSFEITDWTETSINLSKRTISLNMTKTIINIILMSDGYSDAWTSFLNKISGTSIQYDYSQLKTKYITNTILDFITINEKTPIKLFVDPSSTAFSFETSMPEDFDNFELVENTSTSMSEKNGTYRVSIKNLEKKRYYATAEIKLISE